MQATEPTNMVRARKTFNSKLATLNAAATVHGTKPRAKMDSTKLYLGVPLKSGSRNGFAGDYFEFKGGATAGAKNISSYLHTEVAGETFHSPVRYLWISPKRTQFFCRAQ